MLKHSPGETTASRGTGSRIVLTIMASLIALLVIPAVAQATNVYAAASLREAFQKIDGSEKVTYNFAGSGALQTQIEGGAPADVFASASPDEAQALFKGGLCERPVTFVTNEVAMLVPKGNPSGIKSIYDLKAGGRTMAIGVENVPIGKYTREVLTGMGLLDILASNTVSEEANVTGITSKVATGAVDVGFAYVTDGKIVADQGVEIIRLPEGSQPKVRYQICVVKRAGADTAGAKAYIAKVIGKLGRKVLSEAGFGLPPDATEIKKRQQQVKKAKKQKIKICKKANRAKSKKARNARKLRTRCSKATKKVKKARAQLKKAQQPQPGR